MVTACCCCGRLGVGDGFEVLPRTKIFRFRGVRERVGLMPEVCNWDGSVGSERRIGRAGDSSRY